MFEEGGVQNWQSGEANSSRRSEVKKDEHQKFWNSRSENLKKKTHAGETRRTKDEGS